ncbi:MAG: transcriptional regulator [Bacteroidetes bacterium GWC2_33_15]|nr:MAG: transcriptional regulator [Bacteroidetes bacterium GWA2_33_15]OFX48872.1 MAG: transcriptional regulator [Bacteroidetes bacterium GWC2_33_15]OFX66115.1 MAG: transcriptional regulator [Bacteroidetes bacterium GWB2_32_14]OFX68123.1 MAG: transcriptional regulator [Bacteroidetes bacterium GWD2_33_33]HAN17892.1 transcriptional regulator [Bacteroidales bacterium]
MSKYLNFDFLNIEHDNLVPQQGRILISEPLLSDTYFKRSVVLITEHSENGSVGFVLNKPIDLMINEVLGDFPKFDARVYVGGPVAKDTIHFLHTLGELIPGSVQVLDNIYWGGDFDQLKQVVAKGKVKPLQVRFFLGYSGWKPMQLEEEIEENAWLVTEVDSSKIMTANKDIWENTLLEIGKKFKIWANFPENPAMN